MPPILANENNTVLMPSSTTQRQSMQSAHARRASEPIVSVSAMSDFARSHIANWSPPVPVTPEAEALRRLQAEGNRQSREQPVRDARKGEKQLLILDLQDFEIYRAPESEKRAYELTSLQYLEVPITKKLCFDGFISLGASMHFVHAVPIQDSSVEGYGDEDNASVTTYIQSTLASKDTHYDIWYRLNKAAPGYREFQTSFLWVAQLGKHMIDYLESQPAGSIGLNDFRANFHYWLTHRFDQQADFYQWHAAFKHQIDFRVGVNAYIEYFYNQAFNLPYSKQLLAHPLWGECMARGLTAVETQERVIEKTIATPKAFHCFKDMYFGGQLQKTRPIGTVRIEQEQRKRRLGFAKGPSRRQITTLLSNVCKPYGNSPVRVGDVVALIPDETDSRVWRNTNWDWLAYVQATKPLQNGVQRLFVIWIYRHHETNIFKATYPYDNEVFLSDNCNCTEGELLSTDIKGRYDVDWSPTIIDANRFFLRQTYITQESAFVSVRSSHKACACLQTKTSLVDGYHRGDPVYLARTRHNDHILDPVVIQYIDQLNETITVRKLLRLERDCKYLATKAGRLNLVANELVLTNEYEEVAISRIQRRCYIKFVSKSDILNDQVPLTYNRGGAGDVWFLAMGLMIKGGEQNLVFLRSLPKSFNEGPNMTSPQKLRGMSLFSGGGSLDRGLEEGGAVAFDSAVDFSQHAIHTQRANSKSPETMCLFCGSVDDHFYAALKGDKSKLVPRVGNVDLIAAGSPCPGFSALQQNFLSKQSLCNASHISTFCSYVDLYRPLYGVLENVVNMASTRVGYEDQNVSSQVVASLVSMGYQCNQYIMDAWSYGSAQQRSRLILTIAAPGLEPIAQPWHTHARPYEETAGKCLGRLPNGERFGEREHYPTPFAYIPAATVDNGLPGIGTGIVQTCIPFPDHRVSSLPTRKQRALIKCIPRQPPGCGYKEADRRGLIPTLLKDARTDIGKAYRRIQPTKLVPCITTSIVIRDSRNGATLHWHQHRSISVLEARRTQGYLDEEPIIGNLVEQYKIVGNGVDRKVAFAIGLALLKAVQKNDLDDTADGTTQNAAEVVGFASDASIDPAAKKNNMKTKPRSIVRKVSSVPREEPAKTTRPLVMKPRRLRTDETSKNDVLSPLEYGMDTKIANRVAHELIQTSPLPRSRSSSPQTPGFSPRISRPLTADVGRSSLLNMSCSGAVTKSTPMKRNWKDGIEDSTTEGESFSQEPPSKQLRISETPTLDSTTSVEAENSRRECVSSHRHSRGSSTSSTKTRHTRHSRLSVEFVPKHWDKRPEVEMRERGSVEQFVQVDR